MKRAELRRKERDHSLWVDLGCGASKQPGFVGIDRFALPGVDIVCDLNRGIPLPSDSAEYVLASHSLEHLEDLPAAITEIYRVCRDRAVVTIIAPYDSTRLNQANPYHLNAWNEHTARFFTNEDSPGIDSAEYRFPSAEFWALQASDFTQSDVDLRCLRMEFSYLPPYRALDEETKRTLRQSLSDVCDQMALHLLVVKSPIAREELSSRAAKIQYPVPPAFEARRRDEADTSAQNLFSELARTPARITSLSTSTGKEIALLGDEMRRFLQRVDHLDRALVAEAQDGQRLLQRVDHLDKALVAQTQEGQRYLQRVDHLDKALVAQTQEGQRYLQRIDDLDRALVAEVDLTRRTLAELTAAGRTLSERMTAVNSALTRRTQAMVEEVRYAMTEELRAAAEQRSAQARVGEQISHQIVADRRARADQAFWPLRFLRRFRQRGIDLRTSVGGELTPLLQSPETPAEAFKLQLGTFLKADVLRVYPVTAAGSPIHRIEIGVRAIFPPMELSPIARFEIIDDANTVLRAGNVSIDASCGSRPVVISFEPLGCEPGHRLTLKLMPHANVERIGVQLFEWHRLTRLLRRVREMRLVWRGQYSV